MKRLSLYLFLIFFTLQTSSWADDIMDFQIEGMSIGDSLLDYFSKKEIKDNTNIDYYTNDKYTSVEFIKDKRFKIYENVEFNYLTKDKNYIIVAIAGATLCHKNFSKCKNLQKEIESDVSETFKNLEKETINSKHPADKSGKSTSSQIVFWFKNDDAIVIELTDWSKEITQKKRWTDNVSLVLYSRDFARWVLHEANN